VACAIADSVTAAANDATAISIVDLARATNSSRRERVKFELNCFQFIAADGACMAPLAQIVNGEENGTRAAREIRRIQAAFAARITYR
jgi:hypothetical protein